MYSTPKCRRDCWLTVIRLPYKHSAFLSKAASSLRRRTRSPICCMSFSLSFRLKIEAFQVDNDCYFPKPHVRRWKRPETTLVVLGKGLRYKGKRNPTRAARSLSLNLDRTGSCCDRSVRQLSNGFTAVSIHHLPTNRWRQKNMLPRWVQAMA